jgi:hypothetical protein
MDSARSSSGPLLCLFTKYCTAVLDGMVLSCIMSVTTLARRADVTGVGAWEPSCRGFALPKSLKNCNFTLARAVIRRMSD